MSILSGGLLGTRTKSAHNYSRALARPLLYAGPFFRKQCASLLSLMIFRRGISNNNCVDFFDAKTFKNAVLSTLDVQNAPTVQHFVPKSADRQALFSGFGVIS